MKEESQNMPSKSSKFKAKPRQYRDSWGGFVKLSEEEHQFVVAWYKLAVKQERHRFPGSFIEIQWFSVIPRIYYPTVYFFSTEKSWSIALKAIETSGSHVNEIRRTAFNRLLGNKA